jgi:hypothetical protein
VENADTQGVIAIDLRANATYAAAGGVVASTIAPTPGAPATAGVGACFMSHVAVSAQADRRAQLCEGTSLGP